MFILGSTFAKIEIPQRTVRKHPLRSLHRTKKLNAIRRVYEGESKASMARDVRGKYETFKTFVFSLTKREHKTQKRKGENSGRFSNAIIVVILITVKNFRLKPKSKINFVNFVLPKIRDEAELIDLRL